MTEERHHATMRDYLYALRRRTFVIIGIVLVAALAAAALSFTQSKTYTAEASLQALNPAQTAALAGVLESNQELATETSAQLAQTVTRTDVIASVKSQLHLPGSISDITSNISTSTDPQSNFVLVDATAPTAVGAAQLATTLAKTVATITNSQVQTLYARQAASTQKAAQKLLAPFKGLKPGQLTGAQLQLFENVQTQAATEQQNAGKLQTLSQVAQVTQVESLPSVPTSPSGPHPVTNILLGVLVGLLLGLLLTWLLESFDRRLRRPDEIESLLGMPIVGAVQKGGLGVTPTASDDKDGNGIAGYRMLRTNVRFLAPDRGTPPRAVMVTSAVSEEGKTTVAMGLALSSAAAGLNTLLIEADTHRPAHAKRLGLAQGPGIADFLQQGLSPDKVLQVYPFAEHIGGVRGNGNAANGNVSKLTCITAGNVSAFSGDALGSQRFADVVNEVKQVYDLVVIDTAPLLAVAETSEIVTFVDALVFCVRMGKTTAEQVRAARASLQRLPHRPAGIVLTDLQRNVGGYYGYGYGYQYGPDKSTLKSAAAA